MSEVNSIGELADPVPSSSQRTCTGLQAHGCSSGFCFAGAFALVARGLTGGLGATFRPYRMESGHRADIECIRTNHYQIQRKTPQRSAEQQRP
jgi:hypothetical protein